MSIIIKRNTGWMGMAGTIKIKVNGKDVASVNEKQSLKIELPDGYAHLKVGQFGLKSNEVEVRDGDILEIKQSSWHRMSFPLMIAINFLVIFIPSLKYRITIFFSLGVLLILSLFLINGFKVKVSDRGNQ